MTSISSNYLHIKNNGQIFETWSLEVLKRFGLEPHHRVLELGCGALTTGLQLIEHLNAGCYVGVDARAQRAAMAARCAQAGLGAQAPLLGGMELLEALEPRSIDFIVSSAPLDALGASSVDALLASVAEVLADRGRWLGVEPVQGAKGWPCANLALYPEAEYGILLLSLRRYGLNLTLHPELKLIDKHITFCSRRSERELTGATMELLKQLVALDTSPAGEGHGACVEVILRQLRHAGFTVEQIESPESPPLIVAKRPATPGASGSAVVYNHYDVDSPEGWTARDPWTLEASGERLWGLGIGDNKGALAARLIALTRNEPAPALTWLIQGEEESGSPLLTRWLDQHAASLRGTVWIDENGWRDPDGTQRILATRRGGDGEWTPLDAGRIARLLSALAPGGGRRRCEPRVLNKAFAGHVCAFQRAVPRGALYVAVGTNDAQTRIHQGDESIPQLGIFNHLIQFQALMHLIAQGEHP